MRIRSSLTLNIIQFSIAAVIIYGTVTLILAPMPSTYPTATKLTQTLTKLFVYNKSHSPARDITGFGTFSVDVSKVLRTVRDNKLKGIDPIHVCETSHGQRASVPFRCSHFMTLAGSRGRTGNQMFQFAALLGIAHRHNYTAFVKPTFPLTRYFSLPQVADVNITGMSRLHEIKSGVYSRDLERIAVSNNYSLDGYFQSFKYFSNISDIIRNSFKIKSSFMESAVSFMQRIQQAGQPTVCVHIRRGDIHSKSAVKQGYSVAGYDYIQRAMNYFKRKFERVHFIALSEDKSWCHTYLKRNDTTVSPFHMAAVDLAIMTLCDHVIMTSGTFGWWGAWFSSGTVVYYKDFPRPGSWLATQVAKEDYYPPHWIGMI